MPYPRSRWDSGGLGKGSEFTFDLPREEELPALAEDAVPSLPEKKPLRILVVEHNLDSAESLRMVLERQGFRVIRASNGHEGKTAIYNQRPDLVILDMMMPRMGGYPVLEHFRDKPDAPPIIMITANEGSRHKAYAEYLGVIDYIRKPFAMERLLEAVHRGLSGQGRSEDAPAE